MNIKLLDPCGIDVFACGNWMIWVGENPTFSVKPGLKLDFAGTFCRDILPGHL